jgi:V-type H+-transporting ATPase subunit C
MHIFAVRLFVESILRYGLPPQFLAAVMKPVEKLEIKLRNQLASAFGDGTRCCYESCSFRCVR